MKNLTFFKKELTEIIKTYKIIILPAIMLFFGFLSPLSAKFMNKLLEPMLKQQGIDPGAFLKEPSLMDSYAQFFKNFNQMILIAIVLLFMGTVVDEKVKGSVMLVLTKNMSRARFILSKFFACVLLFTLAFTLSVIAFLYYTYILFSKFAVANTALSLFMLWVLGVFIISVTVFASTISKSHIFSAILGFAGYAVTMAVSAIPHVKEYSPGIIGDLGLQILNGVKTAGDAVIPIITTLLMCVLFIVGSITVFKKQEL